MSCDDRRDLLLLYGAGALDTTERAELQAHLDDGCPRCAGALVEAEATLGHLPHDLEPIEPSADARRKLLARIEADLGESVEAQEATVAAMRPRATATWWPPLAAAAAAALVTFLVVSAPLRREQSDLRNRLTRQSEQIEQLEQAVREANRLMTVVGAPEMLLVELSGTENQSGASGRILWDRDQGTWLLTVRGMQAPPPGRTFQLWFVTEDEQKISAGTFDVDAAGAATWVVEVPAGIGPIVLAAVTDEPEGGVPQPTGAFQLLGNVPAGST